MLIRLMNWKRILPLLTVGLLFTSLCFVGCGEVEDEETATVEITNCSGISLGNNVFVVTVEGTIHVNSDIDDVELTAKANGAKVGSTVLGSLSDGQSEDFVITGTIITNKSDLSCEVEASWTEDSI